MIDLNSWPPLYALMYLVLPFGFGMIGMGIGLYLTYTRLPAMLEALRHCRDVMLWANLKDAGPFGRLILLARISATVLFPRLLVKRGLADLDDIQHFPSRLRKWLIAMNTIIYISIAWLLAAYVLWNRH